MTLFRLISFLTGYITVVVRGASPERLINMASARGIWLWNIKWVSQEKIMASLRLSAVRPLRHIARESGCRFSVQGRYGLPFLMARLKKRKTMVAGAFLFLVLLYMLSSFVWFIDVTGNVTVKDSEVLKAARQAGLAVGVLKWNLDTKTVERAIQDNLTKVSWAGVQIKGTRVIVEIVEKKLPPAGVDNRPANIVAAKNGLIKEVLVLKGHPLVAEGQTVKKGQVLISGEIPVPGNGAETGEQDATGEENVPAAEPQYVRAQGIVRARIWYEGYGEVPLVETGTRRTGNQISRVCIKIGSKEIIVAGPEKIPFKKYEQDINTKRLPEWRNISVPVEINTEQYFELNTFTEKRSLAQAREKALDKAYVNAKNKLPENAQVLNREVEQIDTANRENVVRMKVLIETLENIGIEKPFTP